MYNSLLNPKKHVNANVKSEVKPLQKEDDITTTNGNIVVQMISAFEFFSLLQKHKS